MLAENRERYLDELFTGQAYTHTLIEAANDGLPGAEVAFGPASAARNLGTQLAHPLSHPHEISSRVELDDRASAELEDCNHA
jgi:hypothetical protein